MGEKAKSRERRVAGATQPLTVGAFGVIGGIATSVMGAEDAGAVLTVAGLVMLVWGLHRLGRLGPDPPQTG